jgi:hypothetical protein
VTESGLVVIPNLGVAPRGKGCWVCKEVAAPEHVTVLCFDELGQRKPTAEAADYLRSLGLAGTKTLMQRRVSSHMKHVEAYVAAPYPLVPAHGVRTEPLPHVNWLSATQGAVDLGMEAQRALAERLASGEMEDHDIVALAKLGVTAASKQGDLEAKGKSIKQVDRLMMLAAGLRPIVIEGEAREVE